MEINVTRLMDEDCSRFADSIFNSGLQNIGEITWRNAVEYFVDNELLTTELDELRDYFRGFGAWSREELAEMDDVHLNALLLQFIAGDICGYLEAEDEGRLEEYEESEGGRLYKSNDDEWFYYVGV